MQATYTCCNGMPSTPETSSQFTAWLMGELNQRGWSREELARRADLYSSVVSKIVNGESGIGPDVAKKIAKALDVPQLTVFRKAGLIDDPLLEEVDDEDMLTLIKRFMQLPEIKRKMVLSMLEPLLEEEVGEDSDAGRSGRVHKGPGKGKAYQQT